jgi:hypothetical protein
MDDRRVCACSVYGPYLHLGDDYHYPALHGQRAFHTCPSIPAWKATTWIPITQLVCLLDVRHLALHWVYMLNCECYRFIPQWTTTFSFLLKVWVKCYWIFCPGSETYNSLDQGTGLGPMALDYLLTSIETHTVGLQTLRCRFVLKDERVFPSPWFHLWAL